MGFNSNSTAQQVTDGIDATKLTAIVTGATSGIGRETARVLALRGAKVIIPARSMESGLRVKESLLGENPNANLQVMEMDLSSINSITSFVHAFKASNQPLNILINNAGVIPTSFQLSVDGIELQFATNHLGHFLLTNLLLDHLKATAKESGIEGRIVNVSSMAHKYANSYWINEEHINDPSRYKTFNAYSKCKLANILHANELSRRLKEEGSNVTANSLHPGIIRTNIDRHMSFKGSFFGAILGAISKPLLKSISQGASTTCYVALHPDAKGATGKYFVNCNEAGTSSVARDGDLGKKLWDISQHILDNLDRPK